MKIYINAKIREGAWGGGNQFLKALSSAFAKKGVLASSTRDSEVIIFNSYQDILPFIKSIVIFPFKKRIWRLGPEMSIHRRGMRWKLVDYAVAIIGSLFAHCVIFQSDWSFQKAKKYGFFKRKNIFIISNAVDESIFFQKENSEAGSSQSVISLIYTSWSSNINKGFSYIKFLDDNLDFSRYHMKFIGNSPITFKNIEMFKAVSSISVADNLRQSDIFISPTKDDACSNAILEALACGLPVVALRSGGNPELVKDGGLLFSNEQEMLQAIDTVARDLDSFRGRITVKSISEIADEYISAIRDSIK